MKLRLPNPTIDEFNAGRALQLALPATSVAFLQSANLTDPISDRNHFNLGDWFKESEIGSNHQPGVPPFPASSR